MTWEDLLQDAADGDGGPELAGEAETVRRLFDALPIPVTRFEGSEIRYAAANAAYRDFVGRSVVGLTVREALPEVEGQQDFGVIEHAYATGEPMHLNEWFVRLDDGTGVLRDRYVDVSAYPWRDAHGSIGGVDFVVLDATERVQQRKATEGQLAEAEQRYAQALDVVTALQRELLPASLPVLPSVRLAGDYLLAESDSAAGGDWFDALPLPDGRVALVVGDVVGHGARASAVMGQLRTLAGDRLRGGAGAVESLEAVDRLAREIEGARAATLCICVLDPASGAVTYVSAGHPPPLVVATDGTTRLLPESGSGPLATGASYQASESGIEEGELLVLYSDGILERPGITPRQGSADLARTVSETFLDPRSSLAEEAIADDAERVCRRSIEILTRITGHTDDITVLAAQRTPAAPDFAMTLPAAVDSVRSVQFELGQWLLALRVREEDESGLQHAVVELVTNAVEHAYASQAPGAGPHEVTVRGRLDDDGRVEITVADGGRWKEPRDDDPYRGHGLAMVGTFSDDLRFDRGPDGTSATLSRRLRRPVRVGQAAAGRVRKLPPGELTMEEAPDVPGRLRARGVVDTTTAAELDARLRQATRNGIRSATVDLSGLSHLASAGVQTLHHLRDLVERNGQALSLYAPAGSPAQAVLSLVALPHTTDDPSAPDGP